MSGWLFPLYPGIPDTPSRYEEGLKSQRKGSLAIKMLDAIFKICLEHTPEFDCPRIVKQDFVLSSNLLNSYATLICAQNIMGWVYTGTFVINDVLYVDDTTDLNVILSV